MLSFQYSRLGSSNTHYVLDITYIASYYESQCIASFSPSLLPTSFLQGLTNWGRKPIVPDLYPDADSIQFQAFYQVCESGAAENAVNELAHSVTSNGDTEEHWNEKYGIVVTADPLVVVRDRVPGW